LRARPGTLNALRILALDDPDRFVGRIALRPLMFVDGRNDRHTNPEVARHLQRSARRSR